jgi:adenosine deaminase
MNRKDLYNRLKKFPKVDLHRHLEGSISPETLLRLSEQYGGILPEYDLEKLKPLVQVKNDPPGFRNFLSKFELFRGFYSSGDVVEDVAFTAVKDAAEDSVKYLELRYSPTHFASNGRFKELEAVKYVQAGIVRACREFDIVVCPILTISRDYGFELARKTVELAVGLPQGYFYGIDIAGNEVAGSAHRFAPLFEMGRKVGLGITIHAGEVCGSDNVRQAVVEFRADRIGHGIRAVEDESVMELLCRKNIMLEVCISSNFYTASVSSIKAHPVKRLMEYGVPLCLNTDDPAIIPVTLTDEYVLAVADLSFTEDDLKLLNLSALEHAFYPDKKELKNRLKHYWE